MIVLALDTSTRPGGCAVLRDGAVVREAASDPARPQAERLPGELARILDAAGVALAAVDVFAVTVGPGSFTGLRVGIATMQGLAFAGRRPLIGVSALDALAAVARADPGAPPPDGPVAIATWIDAWRGEVYEATYDADGGGAHGPLGEPIVGRPEHLLAAAAPGTVFVGDGASTHAEAIRAALGDRARLASTIDPPIAGAIARLAAILAAAGERPGPESIRPLYVRRSDAERARDDRAVR